MDEPQLLSAGVVILGMHRSGTSALVRLLGLLGLELPSDNDLIPASEFNPGGHWESRRLVDLNERILRSLGGTWSAPPSLQPGWEHSAGVNVFIHEAESALKETFRTRRWAWKDPRLSILLPFWRRISEPSAAVVIWRNPFEVASSLSRRDRFPVDLGLAIWIFYTITMLRSLAGLPVAVLPYETLMKDPKSLALQLSHFIPGVSKPSERQLEQVDSWIDPNLRHDGAYLSVEPLLRMEANELSSLLRSQSGDHSQWEVSDVASPSPFALGLLDAHRVSAVEAWDLERELSEAKEILASPSVKLIVQNEIGPRVANVAVVAQNLRQKVPWLSAVVNRVTRGFGYRDPS